MAGNTTTASDEPGRRCRRVVWQRSDGGSSGPCHQPSTDNLDAFLERYEHEHQTVSLQGKFGVGEVRESVETLVHLLCSEQPNAPEITLKALETLRVLTRTRTELEALVESTFVERLLTLAGACIEPESFSSLREEISDMSLRLLVNICVLHQHQIMPLLMQQKRRTYETLSRLLKHFHATMQRSTMFVVSRLLFYFSIDNKELEGFHDKLALLCSISEVFIDICQADPFADSDSMKLTSELLRVLFSVGCLAIPASQEIWRNITPSLLAVLDAPFDSSCASAGTILESLSFRVQQDAINLLFCFETNNLLPFCEDERVLKHILQILDFQAHLLPQDCETALVPTLSVLESLSKGSPTALRQCKLFVFGDLAEDPTKSCPDEVPEEEKGEHRSLQAILKQHITSFKAPLKLGVSSFLWVLSSEQANEYIRLVGFGNAIGHLVHLNLPGFKTIQQQSISIDELMKGCQQQQQQPSGESSQIEEDVSGKNVLEHNQGKTPTEI